MPENNTSQKNVIINIIKKKKSGEEAHGHGAWKVAYADFMTAMMAFFLLMWLLGIASKEQKAGLATYFSPISMESVIQQENFKEMNDTSPGYDILNLHEASYESVKEALTEIIEDDVELAKLKDNITIEKTPEGILINITSKNGKDIFNTGESSLTKEGMKLVKHLAAILKNIPNKLKISGHTDGVPVWSGSGFSNWELSSNRANTIRRVLYGFGVNDNSFVATIGYADKNLMNKEDPLDPVNKRATILIMEENKSEKLESSINPNKRIQQM